jgi:hypothetical protein
MEEMLAANQGSSDMMFSVPDSVDLDILMDNEKEAALG